MDSVSYESRELNLKPNSHNPPRTLEYTHSLLVELGFYLRKEGYKPSTIESNVRALKLRISLVI